MDKKRSRNWIETLNRESLARQITEQEAWMAQRGGNLEGYRQHYILNPDAIYNADEDFRVALLEAYYQESGSYELAVTVLGEEYFA